MGFAFYEIPESILCFHNDNLILAPFGDYLSGYYPIYKKAEVIKENVHTNLDNYGILIRGDGFNLVEDSHEGFQPVIDLDVLTIMKIMSKIINLMEGN